MESFCENIKGSETATQFRQNLVSNRPPFRIYVCKQKRANKVNVIEEICTWMMCGCQGEIHRISYSHYSFLFAFCSFYFSLFILFCVFLCFIVNVGTHVWIHKNQINNFRNNRQNKQMNERKKKKKKKKELESVAWQTFIQVWYDSRWFFRMKKKRVVAMQWK